MTSFSQSPRVGQRADVAIVGTRGEGPSQRADVVAVTTSGRLRLVIEKPPADCLPDTKAIVRYARGLAYYELHMRVEGVVSLARSALPGAALTLHAPSLVVAVRQRRANRIPCRARVTFRPLDETPTALAGDSAAREGALAALDGPDGRQDGETRDVSVGGLCLRAALPLTVGSAVAVAIELGASGTVRRVARVAAGYPDGEGAERHIAHMAFVAPPEDADDPLVAFCRQVEARMKDLAPA